MQGTRVYLVRHGETEWNNSGRYQGHSDVDLSSKGRLQAELLRERFRHISLDGVYSSDLSRARETAVTIAAPHGLEVNTVTGLREINFGTWEGLTYQEIVASFPCEWEAWRRDPANKIVPGGESFRQVKERVWEAFNGIVRQEMGRSILLVAHGGSLRTLICAILGLDLTAVWRFRLDNTGVSIVDCYDDKHILVLLNDTHHLETLGGPDGSGIL
ncbi:Alpha-ribazole phosphatase, CobC [Moorella glycerini]|uniref:Alpha-ribazole phosphatase n=1 Tax=Neomoorella stamsii TaxID=1266720 RepID=A0A9X7J229_9FIRM|nr:MULTISPECIES: alpha-ribazole phosphatase [Moorella]PRR71466.1 Phosphoserine phosphatase 1 [Moorella stamsii]CEP68675.1 Alpha-ribazole phosphatase, CobC [Moorella glycerini]